jgi:hypothetical protein
MTDIQTPRRPRRPLGPTRVTLLENPRAFEELTGRYEAELPPRNILHESDLLVLSQTRWRYERLDMLQNEFVNWQLNRGRFTQPLDNRECLTLAFQECLGIECFPQMDKQYLATIKTMHVIAGRVERRKSK